MDRRTFLACAGTVAGVPLCRRGESAVAAPQAIGRTRAIAAAATSLLATLDAEQTKKLCFAFPAQTVATAAYFKGGKTGDMVFTGEKYGDAIWSNFPVSDVPRPGLRFGELNAAQRAAALRLLQTMLSPRGYAKVETIMGSDEALAETGVPYAAGTDAYTLAIFGRPSDAAPWMIQFGGHHLALNLTMRGGQGVMAPVLTGCLPAIFAADGRKVRALARENDLAFALLASLDDHQRPQALCDHPVSTLALGPGHDGEMPTPLGLKALAMDASQRVTLLDLIGEWAGMVNADYAAPRLTEIRNGLDETRFAWSGPPTHVPGHNGASYFRVQGPSLFIEWAPQQPGGDLTMHVHTIYRDTANAYGRRFA